MLNNANLTPPIPQNEPVLSYLPRSAETEALKSKLSELLTQDIDIPLVINGKEVRTGETEKIRIPHNHQHVLGKFHKARRQDIEAAVEGSLKAWRDWSRMPHEDRAAVFLRAGELLAKKHRFLLNAATMLGQSKTCHQAEIDSACELIDFFRFNVHFQNQMQSIQPLSAPGQWNQLEYRPLEGFVFAITPFNFTSIAGNLPTSPALLGNVSVWKPASTAVYSGYFIMKLLMEAGLPPGVIQFVPGSGTLMSDVMLSHPSLAGVHFTGSTEVFQTIWKTVGENIHQYKNYPRLVGETGGKDFIMAHPSTEVDVLATAIIRGAFEYQGQKCSAASRAYVPKTMWGKVVDRMKSDFTFLQMGDIYEFRNFMGAVIDKASFNRIQGFIEKAKSTSGIEVIHGGKCEDKYGYFIEPTILQTQDPKSFVMSEEVFGPVISIYVYDDAKFEETLELCDQTSPYALTGAILGNDRRAIEKATQALAYSAGNFYINNKPTGAVVGQQPFGGGRASGTNDKAGSLFNLLRWTSLRTVCETFAPPTRFQYPFMEDESR